MKNKHVRIKTFTLFGELILKLVIAYLLIIIVLGLFVDGIYNNDIANYLYENNAILYYFCVSHKGELILGVIIITFLVIIYDFIKNRVQELNMLYSELDKVLDTNNLEFNLPPNMNEFLEKLNKIKYDYLLSQEKFREAESKKNDLIVYLAHDLKTPLTSVIGYLSLLDEVTDMPKSQESKYIKTVLDKAYKLEDLINELFDVARFNSEKIILEKEELDLKMMLEQLMEEFYPLLKEKNKEIKLDSPLKVMIWGDSNKLARVFSNLLKNAINYSTGKEINIKVTDVINYVEVQISNKGKNISKEKLQKIFEKFYRIDEARTSQTGGSGLGLAIAKEIVNLHGGDILATSENSLTTFIVKLPKNNGIK